MTTDQPLDDQSADEFMALLEVILEKYGFVGFTGIVIHKHGMLRMAIFDDTELGEANVQIEVVRNAVDDLAEIVAKAIEFEGTGNSFTFGPQPSDN